MLLVTKVGKPPEKCKEERAEKVGQKCELYFIEFLERLIERERKWY